MIGMTAWNDTPDFTDETVCVVCEENALCIIDTCNECLQDQKDQK